MQTVYLLVGVPGSGKTWVLDRLPPDKFTIIRNDDFIDCMPEHTPAIVNASRAGGRPVICDVPFSMSMVTVPLGDAGVPMKAVYLIEDVNHLLLRWHERKTKQSAQDGHLTRQQTYQLRAMTSDAPCGTSDEMLEYLSRI